MHYQSPLLTTIAIMGLLISTRQSTMGSTEGVATPEDEETTAIDPSKFHKEEAEHIAWFKMPDRKCPPKEDFCPQPQIKPKIKPERKQLAAAGGIAAAAGGVLAALGHVNSGLGEVAKAGESANGIIAGVISNLEGIGALIRGGIDLAKTFGLGPQTRAILIDNRCGDCDLWVRCTSATKDSGWIPLEHPDGYIMKFVTHLPGWEYGIGNIGLIFWKCEYKDDKTGKIIIQPAFGGSAPRETVNLFEVRKRGLFRMDQETGRIDARQRVVFW